jgi:hypothetical protein
MGCLWLSTRCHSFCTLIWTRDSTELAEVCVFEYSDTGTRDYHEFQGFLRCAPATQHCYIDLVNALLGNCIDHFFLRADGLVKLFFSPPGIHEMLRLDGKRDQPHGPARRSFLRVVILINHCRGCFEFHRHRRSKLILERQRLSRH